MRPSTGVHPTLIIHSLHPTSFSIYLPPTSLEYHQLHRPFLPTFSSTLSYSTWDSFTPPYFMYHSPTSQPQFNFIYCTFLPLVFLYSFLHFHPPRHTLLGIHALHPTSVCILLTPPLNFHLLHRPSVSISLLIYTLSSAPLHSTLSSFTPTYFL